MARRRFGYYLTPTYQIRRQAVAKGVFGNSRLWRVVAALIWGRQLWQALFGRKSELLISEALQPGETMTIRTTKPPPGGRRAGRRGS
jgi:hypothetical protein